MMMFDLTGKTALVTGARSIGQQKCEAVLRQARFARQYPIGRIRARSVRQSNNGGALV
jgi:NAD(P)-dependent dehydrogenase (short-subunit alcohol dehydrogenase family)